MRKCKDKNGNEIADLFNYYVNEHTGVMTIYYGTNISVCEMSDCENMADKECEELMYEVLEELGYEIRV